MIFDLLYGQSLYVVISPLKLQHKRYMLHTEFLHFIHPLIMNSRSPLSDLKYFAARDLFGEVSG